MNSHSFLVFGAHGWTQAELVQVFNIARLKKRTLKRRWSRVRTCQILICFLIAPWLESWFAADSVSESLISVSRHSHTHFSLFGHITDAGSERSCFISQKCLSLMFDSISEICTHSSYSYNSYEYISWLWLYFFVCNIDLISHNCN